MTSRTGWRKYGKAGIPLPTSGKTFLMDDHRVDYDMGDDEQSDEIRAYEKYIEDPPRNLVISDPDDEHALGISEWLSRESTRRSQVSEAVGDDDRPAEEAAMEVESEQETQE